jgi:hypothetical protein
MSTLASAGRAAQRNRGSFDGQTAGDLAHRRKQRKSAIRVGHGLIGNGRCTGRYQAAGLLRIRREVKIGKENLVRLEPAIFNRLRLLHLDDHLVIELLFAIWEQNVETVRDLNRSLRQALPQTATSCSGSPLTA